MPGADAGRAAAGRRLAGSVAWLSWLVLAAVSVPAQAPATAPVGAVPAPVAAPTAVVCGDLLAFAAWLGATGSLSHLPDVDFSRHWVLGWPWLARRIEWGASVPAGGSGRLVCVADPAAARPQPGRYCVVPRGVAGVVLGAVPGNGRTVLGRPETAAAARLPVLRWLVLPVCEPSAAAAAPAPRLTEDCLRFAEAHTFAAWCGEPSRRVRSPEAARVAQDWVDFGAAVVLVVTAPGLAAAATALPQVSEEEGVDVLTLPWAGPAAPAATVLCAVARRPHQLAVVLRPTDAALGAGAAERTVAVFPADGTAGS
ncbi:MAG: hypothetical protein JNK49_02365 [Planctomycetes bacterium]|nr:hypothetical protein [Planctomycetota bacterium]